MVRQFCVGAHFARQTHFLPHSCQTLTGETDYSIDPLAAQFMLNR